MAHYQQLQFVEMAAKHMAADWAGRRVLEIGSADVNGSIRPFFAGSDYTGVDLSAAPGVDLVASGHEVALPDNHVDLAISCECFEHNPLWRETFVNMHRMTMAGGVVVVTCASRGRAEHGTTRTRPNESPGSQSRGWDYYRNLNRDDFERRLDLPGLFECHAFFRNHVSDDLYFAGRKRGATGTLALDLPRLWSELAGVNTLVTPDARRRGRDRLRMLKELPLKWARYLPDPAYQEFALRWAGTERAIRRALRGK
jgi:SAM-dependent methyltransferase